MADKVFLLLGVWTVCVHSWSRQVTLDPDGKFNVSWDLVPSIRDRSDLDIVFEVSLPLSLDSSKSIIAIVDRVVPNFPALKLLREFIRILEVFFKNFQGGK